MISQHSEGRPTRDPDVPGRRSLWVRLGPWAIFAVLAALTGAVWMQQRRHHRDLLERHTEDVAVQAARRLESFLESRLLMLDILAEHWAASEGEFVAPSSFEKLGLALVTEIPGYGAVRLITPTFEPGRIVALDPSALSGIPIDPRLLELSLLGHRAVLSPPHPGENAHFHVVVPARRQGEAFAFIAADLRAAELIDDCFRHDIRTEFSFWVWDELEPLFRHPADAGAPEQEPIRSAREITVRNRRWELTLAPRPETAPRYGSLPLLAVPLLGLLLSGGIAALVRQLSFRMDLFRAARDRAVREVRERAAVQEALRASESRYRRVFDSAADGLLVLDKSRRVLHANPAAATLHRSSPHALGGVLAHRLVAREHCDRLLTFLGTIEEKGTARLEADLLRGDGSLVEVEIRGTRFTPGHEGRLLLSLTDVSERREATRRQAQLSRKVLLAQEEERARLSRELHDDLGQLLTALRLELAVLEKTVRRFAGPDVGAFHNSYELVEKAASSLRNICQGLRPPLLDDLGMEPAIRQLVQDFEERSQTEVLVELLPTNQEVPVAPEVALTTYRILQEALTNVSRHSNARHLRIALHAHAGVMELTIHDDGNGFDPLRRTGSGSGIEGMEERASLVGGSLEIRSTPGVGTTIAFRVPLEDRSSKEAS